MQSDFGETVVLHVDMDAFFASAELLRHPEWRGKPLVVGSGPDERGVVSTCSYEARKFGVHSAMPSRTAYKLCPHAIFTYPDMAFYKKVSDAAFEVFSHYSPYVEAVSIDEAFLDITGTTHLYGGARRLGEALRREVRERCGVTCSVGIAPNRLLAKIGSEQHKPDGLTMMPFEPNEIRDFLASKPIGIIWGVGKKTVESLRPYGITLCKHLQEIEESQLATILGSQIVAKSLKEHAFGISSAVVAREEADEKSVSREWTFDEDVADREKVRSQLLELVAETGRRFRREKRWAKTAKLKLRTADFKTLTRQMPLPQPSCDDIAFRKAALALFDAEWPPTRRMKPVRLIGFGVTNIQTTPGDGEPLLFADSTDQEREKHERLSAVLDKLRSKKQVLQLS